MAKGIARVSGILFFWFALIAACSAQTASGVPGPVPVMAANSNRPRIFQAGPGSQSLQLALSSKPAQITPANFRLASSEEVEGMELTLQKYTAAFESLSLPQVRQVWPGLDREHETAFKKVFAAFRETAWTRSLALECSAPKVTGETASVECLETLRYGKPKGKSKEVGPTRVAIVMKGQSSNWVVADMKGAN